MFSERIAAPAQVLYPLAPSTTYDEGAMIEPTAVAYRAVRTAEVGLGQRVAVLGAGAIGSLVALLCQAAGVGQLLVTDVKEYNLDLLQRLTGCHTVNVAHDSLAEAAHRVTEGAGFDAVIVTSGAHSSLREALQLCRPRGIVAIVALYAEEVSADLNPLVTREIQVRGSLAYTQADFRAAAALINRKAVDVRPLITAHVRMEEAPRIFQAIVAEGLDHVKVMIDLT
jgi:2-desacetyl-2-hydroxyethyl bacteriochlorophyllide A dehydrogenase